MRNKTKSTAKKGRVGKSIACRGRKDKEGTDETSSEAVVKGMGAEQSSEDTHGTQSPDWIASKLRYRRQTPNQRSGSDVGVCPI